MYAIARQNIDIDALFAEVDHDFDAAEGTVHDPDGRRLIYLSSDVVRGIHHALEFEAGEAWRGVLEACGRRWGRMVGRRLDESVQRRYGIGLRDLSVEDFVRLIETWACHGGWGRLRVDLTHALKGVVRVELHDSLFSVVLDTVEGPVDALLAGLLASVLSELAGQRLGCVEVRDGNRTDFVISGEERLADAEASLPADGVDVPRLLAALGVTPPRTAEEDA